MPATAATAAAPPAVDVIIPTSVDDVYDAVGEVVRGVAKVRGSEAVIDASAVPSIVEAAEPHVLALAATKKLHPHHAADALREMQDALWETLTAEDGAGSDLNRSRPFLTPQDREHGTLPVIGQGSIDVAHLADVALLAAVRLLVGTDGIDD